MTHLYANPDALGVPLGEIPDRCMPYKAHCQEQASVPFALTNGAWKRQARPW